MTRKDYELIASVFAVNNPGFNTGDDWITGRVEQFQAIINDTANMLANDNPRFDRERFLKACGVK